MKEFLIGYAMFLVYFFITFVIISVIRYQRGKASRQWLNSIIEKMEKDIEAEKARKGR